VKHNCGPVGKIDVSRIAHGGARQYSIFMIRAGIIAIGAFLTLLGIHFVADGRRKVEGNLVFAGAAICLIGLLVALFALANPAYSLR